MQYCKINLNCTNYQELDNWKYITDPAVYPILHTIYKTYCDYKKFNSVMPLFNIQFSEPHTDIIGYYDDQKIIAFSLIKRYDSENAEAIQFAWDYSNPKLRLGISSLKNECAIYKKQGFTTLYLGLADQYKQQLDGFELLGKLK